MDQYKAALEKIARRPVGGKYINGTPEADRQDMILEARGALGPEYMHAWRKEADTLPVEPPPPTFVQRMYALTNDFHIRTGLKVRISDIYDTYFVTGISGVEADDQPGFERAIRARLEEQHSGWNSLSYPKEAK